MLKKVRKDIFIVIAIFFSFLFYSGHASIEADGFNYQKIKTSSIEACRIEIINRMNGFKKYTLFMSREDALLLMRKLKRDYFKLFGFRLKCEVGISPEIINSYVV